MIVKFSDVFAITAKVLGALILIGVIAALAIGGALLAIGGLGDILQNHKGSTVSASANTTEVENTPSADQLTAATAVRQMKSEISVCKGDVIWPESADAKRCIGKAVSKCRSTKLSDAANQYLLEGSCIH
jgi:hypothetical protein